MNVGLQHKLSKNQYVLATILPILLIIILAFTLATTFQKNINLNQKEIAGTHQLQSLFKLSGLVQKVRGLNHVFLRNNNAETLTKRIHKLSENTELSIDRILSDKVHSLNMQQDEKLTKLKKDFKQLIRNKESIKDFQRYFNEYSNIVDGIISLMRDVAIHSTLVLDAQHETYHLGMLLMEGLPQFSEEIGKARGIVSAIPITSTLSAIDAERINSRAGAIRIVINRLEQQQETILKNTKDIESNLHYNITKLKYSAITYNNLILSRKQNDFSINTPLIIFDNGTEVINSAEILHSKISNYLRGKLNQRISNNRQYLLLTIIAALLAIAIILLFGIFVYRTNNKNLSKIIKSRTMLETILNTIPVGVYWKDLDGKYLGANKVYLQNIGNKKFEYIYGKMIKN